jgi:CubicO group peptidase (beta-lactamase class C family)
MVSGLFSGAVMPARKMEWSRRGVLGASVANALLAQSRLSAAPHPNSVAAIPLDGSPCLAAGAVRRGRIWTVGGKGMADGRVTPAGADTIFEIGSLTKTFTACLIFQLREEGRLRIEAPIGQYVPDLPIAWRGLPLSQLLSHTAGLPEYLDEHNFRTLMPKDLAPRDIVALVADRPMSFEPGTRHLYNNTGFILLGMVAEEVTGSRYWDELHRRFFAPAGMRSTGPRGGQRPERLATGHFWNGSGYEAPPYSTPGSTWSAGGLLSTAADLNCWSIALDHGKILSADACRRMWTPATLANGDPAGWGYGWEIDREGGKTIAAHGGGTAGFSCWYRRDTVALVSTIVLTNQNGRADPKSMTDALLATIQADRR